MKSHLIALVLAIMLPIGLFCIGCYALPARNDPLLLSEAPGELIIHFPDSIFEAVVRELIDKPKGDIFASDVAGITELDVTWIGITDLTGIEYFTALEVLSCGENLLTKLDIGQNTKLQVLECAMNQLTTLDVSQNLALTYLSCWENQLATLDVSKNIALTDLDCIDNRLAALDVSKNIKLTELRCSDNQLTMLDVSQNPALTLLFCDGNQLTALDVSQNPALTQLYCDDNQLTTLDISQNFALSKLCVFGNLFPDRSAIVGLDESRLTWFIY